MARRNLNWGSYYRRREVLDIQREAKKAWDSHLQRTAEYDKDRANWRARSKSARIDVPPRDRPLAALKRDIYRLACQIHDRGHQNFLEVIVLKRQQYLELTPKLRSKTVIDWTVRLIRYAKAERGNAASGGHVNELFSAMNQTRIVTELDFAFANNIRPELCTTFINEVGGYEIIGPMLAAKKNPYHDVAWVKAMQGKIRVQAEKPEGIAGRRRVAWKAIQALKDDEDDDDDWDEDENKVGNWTHPTLSLKSRKPPDINSKLEIDDDGWIIE